MNCIKILQSFCQSVLTSARGTPGDTLFPHAFNPSTGECFEWRNPGEGSTEVSNFSCQQNFLRLLRMLSRLTDDPRWNDAAEHCVKWIVDNATHPAGLIYWGSHVMLDRTTAAIFRPAGKPFVHELKNVLPDYGLLHRVRPAETRSFIDNFWGAHCSLPDGSLSITRHGNFSSSAHWEWGKSGVNCTPHRETTGLSFINTANDLIWAAVSLGRLESNSDMIRWGTHLARQYVIARDPKTNLGAYQFTRAVKRQDPQRDADTHSKYGDRALRQFGKEFGQVYEGMILTQPEAQSLYCDNALMQLELARADSSTLSDWLVWTHQGMVAFAEHCYDWKTAAFHPSIASGIRLSGYVLPRDGYYGKAGTKLAPFPGETFLLPFVRLFTLTEDDFAWKVVRSIGQHLDLGDLGSCAGIGVAPNLDTVNCNPRTLFALIELYRTTRHEAYLALAEVISLSLAKELESRAAARNRLYLTDCLEALAIATFEAAAKKRWNDIETYIGGRGRIHGAYEVRSREVFPDFYDHNILQMHGS